MAAVFYQCSSRVVGLIKTDPNGLVTPSRPPAVPSRVSQPNRLALGSSSTSSTWRDEHCSSPAKIPFRHRDRQHFFPPFFEQLREEGTPTDARPLPSSSRRAREASAGLEISRASSASRAGVSFSLKCQVESVRRVGGPPPWVWILSWARAREDLADRGGPARACPAGVCARYTRRGRPAL